MKKRNTCVQFSKGRASRPVPVEVAATADDLNKPSADPATRAREQLVHVLMNHHDSYRFIEKWLKNMHESPQSRASNVSPFRLRNARGCTGVSRRSFLTDTGMGFTGLALSAMLGRDQANAQTAIEKETTRIVRQPRARSVIWIFLCGGVSHMESFDPKPMLTKYDGKSADDTPYKELFDPQRVNQNLVGINPNHHPHKKLFGMQTGYQRHGDVTRGGRLVCEHGHVRR